jgi:hypothetical protein
MSGNDERQIIKDFPSCICDNFSYWIGYSSHKQMIMFFNPDKFLGSARHPKVFIDNDSIGDIYDRIPSKEEVLKDVIEIVCDSCEIKATSEQFKSIMFFAEKHLYTIGSVKANERK